MTDAELIDSLYKRIESLCARLDLETARADKAEAEARIHAASLAAAGKLVRRYHVRPEDCRDCEALGYHGGSGRCEAHR